MDTTAAVAVLSTNYLMNWSRPVKKVAGASLALSMRS